MQRRVFEGDGGEEKEKKNSNHYLQITDPGEVSMKNYWIDS